MFVCLHIYQKINHKLMIPGEKLLDYKQRKGNRYVDINAIIKEYTSIRFKQYLFFLLFKLNKHLYLNVQSFSYFFSTFI